MKEHNEENKDLTPGKIDTTTDNDNSQDDNNETAVVIESLKLTESEKNSIIDSAFDMLDHSNKIL